MKSILMAVAMILPLLAGSMGLVVSAGLVGSTRASAQTTPVSQADAEAFVGALAEQALGTLADSSMTLEDREDRFRQILSQGFALRYIGLLVLGKHRSDASAEELAEYQLYFSEFILAKYSTLLTGYAGETFAVEGSRPSGKRDILVQSEIRRSSGPSIPMEWRVRRFDADLKIVDIKVEGISMVKSQREEFNAILTREGMTGLIAVLRARTA